MNKKWIQFKKTNDERSHQIAEVLDLHDEDGGIKVKTKDGITFAREREIEFKLELSSDKEE